MTGEEGAALEDTEDNKLEDDVDDFIAGHTEDSGDNLKVEHMTAMALLLSTQKIVGWAILQ